MYTLLRLDIMATRQFLLAKPDYLIKAHSNKLPILEIEFNVTYKEKGGKISTKTEKMNCYLRHPYKKSLKEKGDKLEIVALNANNQDFVNFDIICTTNAHAAKLTNSSTPTPDDICEMVCATSLLRHHWIMAKELLIGNPYKKILSLSIKINAVEQLDMYQDNYLLTMVQNYDLPINKRLGKVLMRTLDKIMYFVDVKILGN